MHTGSPYLYENQSNFLFNFRYAVLSEISSHCYNNSFSRIKYLVYMKDVAGTTLCSVHCEHLMDTIVPSLETGSQVFLQRQVNDLRIFGN